jgi:peptide deformylase
MIRKIVDAKDPILRKKSKEVIKIDKKIQRLAKDLTDTLKAQKDPEGVGLAACQVGKLIRMFAMVDGSNIKVVVNPKLIKVENVKTKLKKKGSPILEGCLSIPNYYGRVKRPQKVTMSYQTLNGKRITEVFTGFPAQIVQHELDHLEGKLFVDEILKNKSPLYKFDPEGWEEVELI